MTNSAYFPYNRISLDNISFQITLTKGDIELLIGIAIDFYCWEIIARLESLEVIEIEHESNSIRY